MKIDTTTEVLTRTGGIAVDGALKTNLDGIAFDSLKESRFR